MDYARKFLNYQKREMKKMWKLADSCGVKFPNGVQTTQHVANTRRPLILFRGKPVTAEQTMQVITGEEPLFGEGSKEAGWWDPRKDRGVLKNIFYRQGYNWLSTWLYSDGTIGGDLICLEKYPELHEILPDYIHLAGRYPFLDMTVSFTTWDENCCFACLENSLCKGDEEDWKCRDCEPYMDKIALYDCLLNEHPWNKNPDFEELYYRSWRWAHIRSDVADFVEITIWIHNGETEVLFGEEAARRFREYDSRYCAPEYAFMFSAELYDYDSNCICSKAFVEDCFAYAGKSRSLCDAYVERGFISPFNEKAVVVTKEWVTGQYNRFIGNGASCK